MTKALKKDAAYADLYAVPENFVAFGVNGPGGWRVLFEPELRFRDDVLVPKLAAWRRERLPAVATGEYPAVAPDWVCEVRCRV
jgi:hypothetical protein